MISDSNNDEFDYIPTQQHGYTNVIGHDQYYYANYMQYPSQVPVSDAAGAWSASPATDPIYINQYGEMGTFEYGYGFQPAYNFGFTGTGDYATAWTSMAPPINPKPLYDEYYPQINNTTLASTQDSQIANEHLNKLENCISNLNLGTTMTQKNENKESQNEIIENIDKNNNNTITHNSNILNSQNKNENISVSDNSTSTTLSVVSNSNTESDIMNKNSILLTQNNSVNSNNNNNNTTSTTTTTNTTINTTTINNNNNNTNNNNINNNSNISNHDNNSNNNNNNYNNNNNNNNQKTQFNNQHKNKINSYNPLNNSNNVMNATNNKSWASVVCSQSFTSTTASNKKLYSQNQNLLQNNNTNAITTYTVSNSTILSPNRQQNVDIQLLNNNKHSHSFNNHFLNHNYSNYYRQSNYQCYNNQNGYYHGHYSNLNRNKGQSNFNQTSSYNNYNKRNYNNYNNNNNNNNTNNNAGIYTTSTSNRTTTVNANNTTTATSNNNNNNNNINLTSNLQNDNSTIENNNNNLNNCKIDDQNSILLEDNNDKNVNSTNMMSAIITATNFTNNNNNNNNNNNMNTNNQNKDLPDDKTSSILSNLKLQNQYNPKDFNLAPKGARFFVIKSYSEDDVHRSIKYNIWCSTEHGNRRLDQAFREREGKGPVYLFFSVNGSGHFCGMAEMMSCVDYDSKSDVWSQDKWKGKFEVKWVYVKDVPNTQLRNIRLENNENKPVTNSRDTQEIPFEKGKQVLKVFYHYRNTTSIFDDFEHYERRQDEDHKKPSLSVIL